MLTIDEKISLERPTRIALALSGGGLRATLFHLGVIRYLNAAGLLPSVKVITSVSGGSITAAHLVKHWKEYAGNVQDFEKIAPKIRTLAGLDLRGRIILRLLPLIPGVALAYATRLRPLVPRTSTELLESYYKDKLYGTTRLSDLDDDELPLLFVVTTNLTRGEASAFWRGGIFGVPIDGEMPDSVNAPGIRLATAVAASSAYPGLFPPLELTAAQIAAQENEFEAEAFADGGVTDNLGVYVLERVIEKFSLNIDTVIVSDAGRSYVGLDRANPSFVWTALRSTDLMMYRIREQQLQQIEERQDIRPSLIAISDSSDAEDSAPRAIEKRLQEVRTDLDLFPKDLASELERHGFFVAEKAMEIKAPKEWRPSWNGATDGERLEQRILEASQRNFWPFSVRDWLSYVYLAALLVVLWFSSKAIDLMKPKFQIAKSFLQMAGESPPWVRPSTAQTERDVTAEIDCLPSNGISIVEQHRTWDLRKLIRSEKTGNVVGPALLTRSLTLVREPDEGVFRFTFQTSGRSVAVWVRDNKYPLRLYRAQGTGLRQVGDSPVHAWCAEVDLQTLKSGSRAALSIQTEVIDAFKARENWWVGLRNDPPSPLASMRIIFPRELRFKNARFSSQPNDRNTQATDLDGIAVLQKESEVLWAVHEPREKWTYRVDWDW